MKARWLFTLLLFSIFTTNFSSAQVGGGILVGGIASQIDGDQFGGYGKLGYHLGGYAFFAFDERFELETEILIGQRGARESTPTFIYHRRLNYIDVPVLLNVRLWKNADNGLMLQGGPYFGILFNANSGTQNLKFDVTDQYKKLELGGLAAMTMEFQEKFGLSFRWGASFSNILATRNPWTRNRYLEIAFRYGWN